MRWCCSLIRRDAAICTEPNTATTSRIRSSKLGARKQSSSFVPPQKLVPPMKLKQRSSKLLALSIHLSNLINAIHSVFWTSQLLLMCINMMVINTVHEFSPKIYQFQNKVDNIYFRQTYQLFQNFKNDSTMRRFWPYSSIKLNILTQEKYIIKVDRHKLLDHKRRNIFI